MKIDELTIRIHGSKRAERDQLDHEAPIRPALVHAPVLVPAADAPPAVQDPEAMDEALNAPQPPSPRDVANTVYQMFVEDARRSRIRRGR